MPAEFVPFSPAVVARAKNGIGEPQSFAPISAASSMPAASVQVHQQHTPAKGDVKVEVKRDGDRITQIRIQCKCGEVIELDCE